MVRAFWLTVAALSLGFWVLLLGSCDVKIQRGGIEPPPKEYRGRGPAPGVQVQQFPTREQVQAYCRANGLDTATEFSRQRKVQACYDPVHGVIAVIERGKIPDAAWREEYDHEAAHSWGLVHGPDGHGWKQKPANIFAQRAPAMTYDWGNVFRGK